MSQTSEALGMSIPEPHVDTWNESMGMVTDALRSIDSFAGDVATVEGSPTSSAHSAGELILYDGRVYEVTSPISSGASLVLGTNVRAAKIGSYIKSLSDDADNLEASIAPVESVTATANHAIGDYFMLGNVLMKATSAIAAGETINASKATPATVQSQIDAIWDTLTPSSLNAVSYTDVYTGVTIHTGTRWQRMGRLVILWVQITVPDANNGTTLVRLTNIPAPIKDENYFTTSNANNHRGLALTGDKRLKPNGNITLAGWLGGMLVYLTND